MSFHDFIKYQPTHLILYIYAQKSPQVLKPNSQIRQLVKHENDELDLIYKMMIVW